MRENSQVPLESVREKMWAARCESWGVGDRDVGTVGTRGLGTADHGTVLELPGFDGETPGDTAVGMLDVDITALCSAVCSHEVSAAHAALTFSAKS